jgi:hypothetical protein
MTLPSGPFVCENFDVEPKWRRLVGPWQPVVSNKE